MCAISSNLEVIHKQHTLIFLGTSAQIPAGKYKKKKSSVKSRQSNYKQHGSENSQVQSQHKKQFDVKSAHQSKDKCSKHGGSAHVEGFQCPAKKFQCTSCHKFWTFYQFVLSEKQAPFKSRKPKVHQLQAGTVYAKDRANCSQFADESSSERFFLLAGQSEVNTS